MRFVLAFFFADRGFLHSTYPKHRLSSQTLWLSILVLLSVGASYVGSGAIDLGTELDEGSVPTIPAGPYDLVPIVSPGDTIPGAPGLVVASVRDMDLNNGGQVAVGLQLEDPLTQELDSTNALYLVDDEQIRPIMGPWPGRGDVELNESGNVGFVDGATLRVANPDEILFEITVGDVVPALGAFITSDPVPAFHFLNDENEVAFFSRLPARGLGLFVGDAGGIRPVAIQGDIIPGTQDSGFNEKLLEDSRAMLLSGRLTLRLDIRDGHSSILVYDQLLEPSVLLDEGDEIPPGITVETLELLDTDEAGRVLLTVNEEYLFLWTGSNFRLILDPRIGLPGLKNGPFSTPLGYLSGEGTVLFGVIASGIGGIYHWRDGTVTAVAVDGDPSPVSDSLWVTNIREDIILLYRTVIRSFPSPVSPTEAVFSAGTAGPQSASVPMVWSAGRLTAINIGSGVSTRNSERLLERLLPIGVDFAGRVLLRGVLCCSDNALYWAVPSAPRVHYLPFLAGGPLDDFRIASDVEISNESPFPAVLDAEFFDSEGFLLSRSRHGLVLPARSTMTLDPGARELFSGYARITIENGAEVAASNSLRLSHSGVGSLSQVTIPPLGPSSRFDVIVQESVRTHMALALTNQHQTPLSIELSLLEADGTDIDQETVDLAGGQQSAFFLGDRMALPEVDFSGRLLLRSDKPFLLEVFSQSGSKLAHLPLFTKPASDPEWGFVPMFPLALDEDELLRGFSFENQVFQSNKSGTIAFPFQEGLWVADPQSGDQILPTSSFPSGDAGQSFPGLRVLAVNEAGDVLFSTQASNTVELMLWEDGSLREIYQGSRPGFDDVRKVLSPSGAVALARLPNGDLLLIDESVEWIVRAGDPLPGGSGETWGPIGSTPVFNSNDDLLFGGVLAVGLFSGGEVQLLVRTEELPGVPATAEFVAPFLVGLSDSGEAFVGASWELSDSDFEIALYVISDDEILPLVLPANPFPGSPETDILGLGGKRVVFSSEAGAGVAQLRVRTSDSQELDAFVRFTANGLEPLVVVDTPEIYEILDFDANSRGDLGFWARDPYNSQSLWFAGLEGLQRLLGEGTRLDGEATSPPGFIRRVIGRPRVFESGDFASYMEVAGGRTNGIYLGQARTSRLYLPLVVAGTFGSLNYESRVLLSNPGIRDTTVEFDLTDMTGDPVTSAPPVILPAGQTRTVEIDSHANLIGWLELRITGQLQALLHLSVLRGNSLESELYMQPSSLERNLAFRVSLDDALTVANPYPRGINVVLEFRDSEGSLLSQSLSVPPNGQMNWLRSPGHLPEIRSTQTVNVSSAVPVPLLPLHMRASGLSVAPAW